MVALGKDAGVATTALLTNMNVPLGLAIGNANEVRESVEVLAGGGPADVVELTIALAREMLALAGQPDADVEAALKNGQAMDTWSAMIRAQGGDPEAALPVARETHVVPAERRVCSSSRRPSPSASPPGASAPVERASRTRCSTLSESTCTPSPATGRGRPAAVHDQRR